MSPSGQRGDGPARTHRDDSRGKGAAGRKPPASGTPGSQGEDREETYGGPNPKATDDSKGGSPGKKQ